jgi:hypothetical protein
VADLVYVVSDGHLSEPLLVMNHPDVETLARAITRLERHHLDEGAAVPTLAPESTPEG